MSMTCDSVCRLCRREGIKLFLKGAKCDTPKCPLTRRDYAPGQHGWKHGKMSEFGRQLREKQKLKRFFGVMERQFRRYFKDARVSKGNTGNLLLQLFERRLDNVLTRMGFATSRAHARSLVVHGHIAVNGKRVDRPSYQLKLNDVITPNNTENARKVVGEASKMRAAGNVPSWVQVDAANLRGVLSQLPTRDEFPFQLQEQMIIEHCSR